MAPVASPSRAQPAPSWEGSLAARQSGQVSPGQSSLASATLPDRASEQSWSSAVLEAHSAPAKQGLSRTRLGCLLFLEEARLPACCSLGFQAGALCAYAGLASGAACPELGLLAGAQARRGRPQPAAHVSAGEESARQATCVRQLLGAQGVSLRVCGAADPSQGPWEPGALRAVLSHGGQTTAGGALHLPFPSLSQSSPCWCPWQGARHRP